MEKKAFSRLTAAIILIVVLFVLYFIVVFCFLLYFNAFYFSVCIVLYCNLFHCIVSRCIFYIVFCCTLCIVLYHVLWYGGGEVSYRILLYCKQGHSGSTLSASTLLRSTATWMGASPLLFFKVASAPLERRKRMKVGLLLSTASCRLVLPSMSLAFTSARCGEVCGCCGSFGGAFGGCCGVEVGRWYVIVWCCSCDVVEEVQSCFW